MRSSRGQERALAVYLAIMAAGTAFMIIVVIGGLVRNLVIFSPSRRSAA